MDTHEMSEREKARVARNEALETAALIAARYGEPYIVADIRALIDSTPASAQPAEFHCHVEGAHAVCERCGFRFVAAGGGTYGEMKLAEPEAFVWRDWKCSWRGLWVGYTELRGAGWTHEEPIRAWIWSSNPDDRSLGWFPTQELAQRAVEEAVRKAVGSADHRAEKPYFKCDCPHEVRSGCSVPECPHHSRARSITQDDGEAK
jgi:hypothetical protein